MSASTKDKAKIVVIYLIGFIFTLMIKKYLLNLITTDYSLLVDNLAICFIFSTYLFIFSFFFNNNNFIDFAWTTLGILLIADLIYDNSKRNSVFSKKSNYINQLVIVISGVSLVLMYSIRHLLNYFRGFHGLTAEKEDFRYKEFRNRFDNNTAFWLFSYISFHLIPLVALTFGYQPVFEAVNDPNFGGFHIYLSLIGFILANVSLLFETVADEQLFLFRIQRDELIKNSDLVGNKVINFGLWKYLRHPNYFGEVLFFFSLFIYSYGILRELYLINIIGFTLIFLMFFFFSVPAMETKLLRKYREEYKSYQNSVKHKLLPFIY